MWAAGPALPAMMASPSSLRDEGGAWWGPGFGVWYLQPAVTLRKHPRQSEPQCAPREVGVVLSATHVMNVIPLQVHTRSQMESALL
jgi:hypothetical protein